MKKNNERDVIAQSTGTEVMAAEVVEFYTEQMIDTKTVFSDEYISKLQVRFVRLVGRKLYTHSVLPFPFKLYLWHYKRLKEFNSNYKLYYRCITDLEDGKLIIKGQSIFDDKGFQIAPETDQKAQKDLL